MNELESYIRTHADAFDTESPAAGHEQRFLALLDATALPEAAPAKHRSPFLSRLSSAFRRPGTWALALAACAAAFLLLRPGDPFRRAGSDPEAIYLAYMDEVAGLYRTLPQDNGTDWDAVLRELTEEQEPLFVLLPEELSGRERSRILKAYYGDLLHQARQICK
jgi:hypothetical protein